MVETCTKGDKISPSLTVEQVCAYMCVVFLSWSCVFFGLPFA